MRRMTCRAGSSAGSSAGSPLAACALRRASGDVGPAGRRSRTVGVLLVFLAAHVVHPKQQAKDRDQRQGREDGNRFEHGQSLHVVAVATISVRDLGSDLESTHFSRSGTSTAYLATRATVPEREKCVDSRSDPTS